MNEQMRPDFRPLKPKSERLLTMSIDPLEARREVSVGDVNIRLEPQEYQILWLLNSRSGSFVSEDEIIQFLYEDSGKDIPLGNSIDVRITNLRKKLAIFEKAGAKFSIIRERKLGWRLEKI